MREAARISDTVFRSPGQSSMADAFPFIFSDAVLSMSLGAFDENGRLMSFMGLVPWEIRVGEARLRVFSLGSVFTDPEFRGKGYASDILENVYGFAKRAGASLLLVSGGRSLYTRSGCAAFGRFSRYGVGPGHADKPAGADAAAQEHIREMRPEDLPAMHGLAASRPVGYLFGVHELAMALKGEASASCKKLKHRVLIAEKGGEPTAFVVIGVPEDSRQNGTAIEQAGDPAAIARIVGDAVRRYAMPALDVFVSWHESELHALLSGIPFTMEADPGTVRILDGGALIAQLRPWLEKRGDAAGIRLEQREDGNWLLARGQGPAIELTPKELNRLIFDCAGAENERLPEGVEAFRELFPVPFPHTEGLGFI